MTKCSLKHLIFIISLVIFIGLTSSFAHAEEEVVIDDEGKKELVQIEGETKGFFAGIGPTIGFEMYSLKSLGGGAGIQVGYRINNMFTVLMQTDMFYTKSRDVNYFLLPVSPTLKVNFESNFFVFGGAGYRFLYATKGRKFNSSTYTGTQKFNGWGVFFGGGYDFQFSFSDKFFVAPQVGLDYTRIGSSNLILPMVRISCNWQF